MGEPRTKLLIEHLIYKQDLYNLLIKKALVLPVCQDTFKQVS
jgi:hypothetical protein